MNKYTKSYKNLDEFCEEFYTVEELLKWYKTNKVKWPKEIPGKDVTDKPMAWPDNLLKTKVGNCIDHAIFMHYFCVKNNIEHKLIYIQNFVEGENQYLCICHAVGMYKTVNGVNLFDIRGEGLIDRELGPYKSFDDAEKDYPNHYFKRIYFGTMFDSNLYSIKKKSFIVVLKSDELYGFDKYYNNYELTQSVILDAVILPFCIKKYGSRYLGTHSPVNIKRTFVDSMSHSVKKWISDNIGKPLYRLGLPTVESGSIDNMRGLNMNRYTRKYKNLDDFCNEFHTIEELLKWYKANNVQWPKTPRSGDNNDRPMSWPDDIIKTKIGLCWDHAIFMHYYCERNNIPHGALFIQNFVEHEKGYWCIGHVIGLYQSDNGWNFFNIYGREEMSSEIGPYKSAEEAVKKYVKLYGTMAYNMERFNSNLYNVGKKTFWFYMNSNELKVYDKYYNKHDLTQNQIGEEVMDPIMRRKYGVLYPANKKINRSWLDIMQHGVRKWISDNIGKPLYGLGLPTNETGLMGSTNAPIGINNRPFVMQLMSSTFVRPKYAVSNDIFTDNILTTNDSDTLQMMNSDYLKDKKVRIFKYNGKDGKKKLDRVLESVGRQVDRQFLYESISSKDMINDEQIYIDEDFEEIKFDEVKASIENEAYTVLNKYMSTSPTLANKSTIVSSQEASFKLKGHSDSVVIMEQSGLGYFACNRQTMRRTKYYSSINDIVIGSDIDG